MTSREKVIAPQGKRKNKIIFRATFTGYSSEGTKQLESVIAQTMGGMGIFDNSNI